MEITPWNVEGDLDYEKLIKKFGTSVLTDELHGRLKTPMPPALARGMCFSHRDLDKWLDAYERGENVSVITGRGPSNKMHIGHLTLYALPLFFQQQYGCNVYIPISDDEKFLVKRDLDFETVQKHAKDNIIDILAMGFDPDKTYVFRDFESKDIYINILHKLLNT